MEYLASRLPAAGFWNVDRCEKSPFQRPQTTQAQLAARRRVDEAQRQLRRLLAVREHLSEDQARDLAAFAGDLQALGANLRDVHPALGTLGARTGLSPALAPEVTSNTEY